MAKKKTTLRREQKEDLIEKLMDHKKEAETGHSFAFKRMSKCERYAIGQQWDRDVLEENKRRRKFSLTINRIFPVINQLSGFEAKNPKDIKTVNLKGGTQKGAELLTSLTKHTLDQNHSIKQQNQCFEDGIRAARGFIEVDICYEQDPIQGDLTVRKLDPFMVLPDPSCTSYDYNDQKNGAKYLLVEEWIDKGQIIAKYPAKKADLGEENLYRRYKGPFSGLMSFLFGNRPGDARTTYRENDIDVDKPEVDFERTKFRISKYYWKEWVKGAYLVRDGKITNSIVLTNKDDLAYARQSLEENPGAGELIESDRHGNPVVIAVLHKAVMAGDVMLEYIKDPFKGANLYPIVRFSPYFVNGYEFGVVDNLLGPQDQINWSWSMELNLIKQLANTGWKIARDKYGTFKEFLQDHGGEDGIVIDESEAGGSVDKLEQNAFPANYDLITERGSKHITEISQVRLEEPQARGQESGKAILAKQNWAISNMSNIMSNWDWTLRLLGDVISGIIRHSEIYGEDEIMSVVDEKDLIDADMMEQARQMVKQRLEEKGIPQMEPPEPPSKAQMAVMDEMSQLEFVANVDKEVDAYREYAAKIDELAAPIAQAMLIDEIKSMKFGRYGTKTELAPAAETNRIKRSIETFELHQALIESGQPGVSRRQLVESTDIVNKEEVIEDVPQTQGAA